MCLERGQILHGMHGNYRIIEQFGEGGFAKTYKAAQLRRTRNPLCVVKEIPFPIANDPRVLKRARSRFESEARALEILGTHSQIPELFDRFENNNNFYLVQEFIKGYPLSRELTRGRQWTEKKTVAFLREVLEILEIVHDANIVHRDIKPANLIRRKKDKKIVLIDFGAVSEIATLSVNSTGEILTTQAIGTRFYMPAEQSDTRLPPKPYNDIYALGITAIQAFTGLSPNEFLSDPVTCELVWHYSTLDRPAVQVSDGFRDILTGMVRLHFTHRYQSVAQILSALDSLEQPESPEGDNTGLRRLLLACAGIATAVSIVLLNPRIFPAIPITSTQPTQAEPSPISPPPTQPAPSADGVSSGEKLLVQTSALWSKQRGISEFADSNYPEALKQLKQSWREDRRDPETLIYMNNALLKAIGAEYYTIAIVVPIRRNQDGSILNANLAEELLRGIAQAQTEVNLSLISNDSDRDFPGQGFLEPKAINGKGLKVIIADDGNIKSYAVQRANYLVEQPDILALIGHYTSDMTVETVDIYNRHKLVALSPGSTTEELTRKPRKFFFRTAPTTSVEAEGLVDRLLSVRLKKVAVFYNPNSPFSASLWEEFKKQFEAKGGKTFRLRNYFDLSKNDFNAEAAIEEVEKAGKTAIAVIPDGQVTNSVENALEMIKVNQDRNWIVGPWTLYEPRTLEVAKQLKSVEKLGISLFWHPLASFDKKFPVNAEKLWGGPVNTRSALTYDAAKTLIKALGMQPEPSREGMQKTLADPNFKAEGATGIIEFDSKTGNRKNPPKRVAHIVPCSTAIYGVTFVPIEFPTAAAAGLKCE